MLKKFVKNQYIICLKTNLVILENTWQWKAWIEPKLYKQNAAIVYLPISKPGD